ncbi:hypothetical protein, partial [Bartonella sp. CL34QHWL]|uniref:hypothetical protein n=1 Tax=Bartonella sp. CL34QHWL TaxID=3243526 RepID=UPI0035CF2F74
GLGEWLPQKKNNPKCMLIGKEVGPFLIWSLEVILLVTLGQSFFISWFSDPPLQKTGGHEIK